MPYTEQSYIWLAHLNKIGRKEFLKRILPPDDLRIQMEAKEGEEWEAIAVCVDRNPGFYIDLISAGRIGGIFDPMARKPFFNKEVLCFGAVTKKQLVGFSMWVETPHYQNQYCIATQLYVLPKYRRKGIGVKLIGVQAMMVDGILADQVNDISRAMYEKYFKAKVVYGTLNSFTWEPDNAEELIKQAALFGKSLKDGKNGLPHKPHSYPQQQLINEHRSL